MAPPPAVTTGATCIPKVGAPVVKVVVRLSTAWKLVAATVPVLFTTMLYGTSKVVALTWAYALFNALTTSIACTTNVTGVGPAVSPPGVAGGVAPLVEVSVANAPVPVPPAAAAGLV